MISVSLSARVQVLNCFLDAVLPQLTGQQLPVIRDAFRHHVEETMVIADDAQFKLSAMYHASFLGEVNQILKKFE